MGFFRSIISLAAICLCITFVYFFGHALSTGEMKPIMYGLPLLVVGSVLIALLSRKRVQH